MTEPTEEARAELDVINAARKACGYLPLPEPCVLAVMRALDKHHGRTPPDPMVAKAERLLRAKYPTHEGDWKTQPNFDAFLAQLHKEFPNG